MRILLSCFFGAFILSATISTSNAALVVHDPLLIGNTPANGEYVNTNEIFNTNPTILGLSATAWNGNGGGTNTEFGAYRSVTGTMSYGNLLTSGGRLNYARSNANANAAIKSVFRDSTDVTDRGTYYASFLLNVSALSNTGAGIDDFNMVGLRFSGTSTANALVFGMRENAPFFGSRTVAQFTDQTSATAPTGMITGANLGSPLSTTHLFVLKIVSSGSGNETISLFVNPTLGTLETEPVTPTITSSTLNFLDDGAGSALSRVFWASNSSASGSIVQFDEMRVGTTWADVVPVPEPGSLAIVSLAGISGLWIIAKRRRQNH